MLGMVGSRVFEKNYSNFITKAQSGSFFEGAFRPSFFTLLRFKKIGPEEHSE